MNQTNDDPLADLLRETFRSREPLADPDRARGLVPLEPAPGRRRAVLVAAAVVAVVAVAGVATYVGRGETDADQTPGAPSPTTTQPVTPDPAVDAARVRAENRESRENAAREAERVLASMPVLDGAERVGARDVPPLARASGGLSGSNRSVTRTGFWLVSADSQELADWYTLNLPPGMFSDGGPHGVGGSRNTDGSWSEDVIYDGQRGGPASHSSALVQVTPVGNRAGVRITVYTSWRPARPLLSFAPEDVTAVRVVITHNGHRRVTIVRAPSDVARVVRTYDGLRGTHGFIYSCRMSQDRTEYRITFVSPTRKLSAWSQGACESPWRLKVDGTPIEPALEDGDRLTGLLAVLAK
jgi:hypothetical protein